MTLAHRLGTTSKLAPEAFSPDARAEMHLLEQHDQVMLLRKETFLSAKAFKIGTKINGRKLGAIGWTFTEHFLGVVETEIFKTQIIAWTLLYAASDKWIFETLNTIGKEEKCALANVYDLMATGQSHINGRSNFAYVQSPVDRRPWAVHWFVNAEKEWVVGAVHVPHPHIDWPAGTRLFSSRIERNRHSEARPA